MKNRKRTIQEQNLEDLRLRVEAGVGHNSNHKYTNPQLQASLVRMIELRLQVADLQDAIKGELTTTKELGFTNKSVRELVGDLMKDPDALMQQYNDQFDARVAAGIQLSFFGSNDDLEAAIARRRNPDNVDPVEAAAKHKSKGKKADAAPKAKKAAKGKKAVAEKPDAPKRGRGTPKAEAPASEAANDADNSTVDGGEASGEAEAA